MSLAVLKAKSNQSLLIRKRIKLSPFKLILIMTSGLLLYVKAFFYFAGHGFSKLASKFMMPVDCPRNQVKLTNCLCEEQLTQILAQGSQLQLLVMLFDCCLIESRYMQHL